MRLTTLPPSCADCLVSLNLLEPSGPVQACNGVALPLHSEPFHKMNIMSFHSKTQPQRYISTRETDDCHLAFFHCNAVNSAPRLNLRESVLQLPQSYPHLLPYTGTIPKRG